MMNSTLNNERFWRALKQFLDLSGCICQIKRLDESVDKYPNDLDYQLERRELMQKYYDCCTRDELKNEINKMEQDYLGLLQDIKKFSDLAGVDTEYIANHPRAILLGFTKNVPTIGAAERRRFVRTAYLREAEKSGYRMPVVSLWEIEKNFRKARRAQKIGNTHKKAKA